MTDEHAPSTPLLEDEKVPRRVATITPKIQDSDEELPSVKEVPKSAHEEDRPTPHQEEVTREVLRFTLVIQDQLSYTVRASIGSNQETEVLFIRNILYSWPRGSGL